MSHAHYLATPIEVVELKAAPGTAGSFTAYASTFGNRDHGGDVIERGAFKASLSARKFRPLLWQHDMREPIGLEKSLREDSKGLIGTWELVDTQRGRDAYALLKAGAVRSMSIGYMPTKWEFQQDNDDVTRVLKEIDLLENSVVSIPMNEQAQVQSVKHASNDHCEFCAELRATEEEVEQETIELTFSDQCKMLADSAVAFGERTSELLAKLQAGDHELTGTKRDDLHALLETFSGLDAVRSTAEALVQRAKPESSSGSYMALALEMRRLRLREHGVEV